MPLNPILTGPEVAHQIGLLPVLWVTLLYVRREPRDRAWWWLAAAFAVSWIADSVAHWVPESMVAVVYPLSQSALIGAVFLDRKQATWLLGLFVLVAAVSLALEGVNGRNLLLRTVAWGAVVGLVIDRPALGLLRTSLLVYFGLGLLCWMLYAGWPGWTSWGAYQMARLVGLVLFCVAASRPTPSLRVLA